MNAAVAGMLGGYAADLVLGDPRRGHPVAGFGRLALVAERLTYRPRRAAGALHVLALVGGAAALGGALQRTGRSVGLGACLWAVLGGRSLNREAEAIGALVAAGELAVARERVPALVGREPAALDADGLCRAAVESVAENTVDAVVAPLLWCAMAGSAGALAYRATNTLDAMVGHRSERYERFGWAAARLDDALSWPAARVAGALTVACAPLTGVSARGARYAWARDGARHPSPNSGRIEAAFAGALGVRLGGPVRYAGRTEARPWLGDGPAPRPGDVARAVHLARLVGGASMLLSAGLRGAVAR